MNKFRLFNLIGGGVLTGGAGVVLALNQKGIIKPKKQNTEKAMKAACCAASGIGAHMIFDGVIDAQWFPGTPKGAVFRDDKTGTIAIAALDEVSGCAWGIGLDAETAKDTGERLVKLAEKTLTETVN